MKNQNIPFTAVKRDTFKCSENLNQIAAHFRTTDFSSKFVSEEGFTINWINGQWEWEIRFRGKAGWICLFEHPTTPNVYHLYAYEYEDQNLIEPTMTFRVVGGVEAGKKIVSALVKKFYHERIQNWSK